MNDGDFREALVAVWAALNLAPEASTRRHKHLFAIRAATNVTQIKDALARLFVEAELYESGIARPGSRASRPEILAEAAGDSLRAQRIAIDAYNEFARASPRTTFNPPTNLS